MNFKCIVKVPATVTGEKVKALQDEIERDLEWLEARRADHRRLKLNSWTGDDEFRQVKSRVLDKINYLETLTGGDLGQDGI